MNHPRASLTVVKMAAATALVLSLANVGCQSGAIDATALPSHLSPPPVVDVHTLPLARLASTSFRGEQISPGDTLELQVVTGVEKGDAKTWPLTVQRDGTIDVPLVGRINVAGMQVDSARHAIRTASVERGIYRRPTVTLRVDERRTNHVTVTGAVEDPGSYQLPVTGSDLFSALMKAGGLAEDADAVVEIRRAAGSSRPGAPRGPDEGTIAQVGYEAEQTSADRLVASDAFAIDLVAATKQPVPSAFQLGDGDVVTVRRRPPRFIQVIGLVNKPDRLRIPPGQNPNVLEAIAMAGGVSESLADRVIVVRQVPGKPEPVTIEVSIANAKQSASANPILADGDVVSVEETPTTFLVSTVKSLIRIGVNSATF